MSQCTIKPGWWRILSGVGRSVPDGKSGAATTAATSAMSNTKPTRRKLAACITELDPGGAERALFQIMTRLDPSAWEIHVYSLAAGGALANEFRQRGIPVTELDGQRHRPFRATRRLAKELRAFQPDLLLTFLYHANIIGRLAAWWAGVPHIVSGIRVAERRSRWRLRLDRWTNGLVDCNICVSQAVAAFSIDQGGLPAVKTISIPNGVDASHFETARPADLSRFGIPRKGRVILFVGRLDPQKAPGDLLAAFERVAETFSDIHLLFVGHGPLESTLRRQVDGLPSELQARVHIAGWQEDIPAILKAGTCLAVPSLWEGMPNVVLEAMASGLPVIATNVDGTTELLIPGETGWLVPPQSPEKLASALRQVLSHAADARNIAENAQTLCTKQFTWDTVAHRYEHIFRELCDQPTS